MASRSTTASSKVHVPFILTKIEENLSWKCWADNLSTSFESVDVWIIGDRSGKIWAMGYKQEPVPEDSGLDQPEVEEFPAKEEEIKRIVTQVNNQGLVRSTGITLAGNYYGFVQGNKIDTATFRSDAGCVGISLLRNNYIIAISRQTAAFPALFYRHLHEAANSVKLLGY